MADSNIRNLTPASNIANNDLFVLEQGGIAKKLTGQLLTAFIDRNIVSVTVQTIAAGQSGYCTYNAETGALTLYLPRGTTGGQIGSITKTSTVGLVDTYTVSIVDGGGTVVGSSTFNVTNGADGGGSFSYDGTSLKETPSSMTASATTLPAGSSATATYDRANNNIAFGIPKGDKGDRGEPGPSGTPTWGSITGTLSDQTDLNTVLSNTSTQIANINAKIPTDATSSNQLADKAYVGTQIDEKENVGKITIGGVEKTASSHTVTIVTNGVTSTFTLVGVS